MHFAAIIDDLQIDNAKVTKTISKWIGAFIFHSNPAKFFGLRVILENKRRPLSFPSLFHRHFK